MSRTNGPNRRQFLGGLAKVILAGAGTVALGSSRRAWAKVPASERVRLGLIGCGGMGNRHLDSLVKRTDCQVVAVCDVYKTRYEDAVRKVGEKCKGYQDYRHVFDRNDIDAIFCATPDHWHTLVAIHGCQAGKDVYVEKPLSTTIVEGRAVVNAARRYNRIVQVGTQQRSLKLFQDAVGIVRSGKLGRITEAGAWIGPNYVGGPETPQPVPEGLDWDLWLGPAPWVPFSPQRFGGFRAFHDYANGELTNWGVHLLDVVHWALGQDAPMSLTALGGQYRSVSGSDDYENVEILYEFDGCTVTWEQRHSGVFANKGYGIKFLGTDGRLFIDRQSYVVEPLSLGIPEGVQEQYDFIDINTHHDNFLECLRTRQLPHSDVELGHRSTSTCLLAGIALDCRRRLLWDRAAEEFVGDQQANRYLMRPYRAPWHL